MTIRISQRIKVYCLASFTDDEADEILTQLDDDSHDSYSAADVRVELIPWTKERDGGKEDIFRLFLENKETEEDFMFFIDRHSLDLQDFLVADVRSAKKISTSSTPSAHWSVVETTRSSCARNTVQSCPGTQIVYGRCGRDSGWYGNPYSGIKTTYRSLISGRTTLDNIVRRTNTQPNLPNEKPWMLSTLDVCDEAYSTQARAVQHQASLLSCELQTRPIDGVNDEVSPLSLSSRSGRNSFCLSSSRWALQA